MNASALSVALEVFQIGNNIVAVPSILEMVAEKDAWLTRRRELPDSLIR